MEHKVIIASLPEAFTPCADMLPFYAVRHEKMALRTGKILTPQTVGVRCAGYFRPQLLEETADGCEHDALVYGLTTAQFHLSKTPQELAQLFAQRQDEMICEANAALERSESPVRLAEVVFGYADYCILDTNGGAAVPQYSGFVIGQSATREVTVFKAKGIAGEWQCVCGAYSAPADCCEACGLHRPVYPALSRQE